MFLMGLGLLACSAVAQAPLRLSLQDAIAVAGSVKGPAAVQIAAAAEDAARARVALTRAYRLPLLDVTVSDSNVTRNLGAEGFNFPTGVPGFTIPQSVGPFNIFDARVQMTQTIFDLSAIREGRGVTAALTAAHANTLAHGLASQIEVAHDYLAALRANAGVEAADDVTAQAESLMETAQHRVDAGQAADSELDEARLRLATSRRSLAAAQNEGSAAMLQLVDDLGLDLDTRVELTDHLAPPAEDVPEIADAVALALRNRPELQTAAAKQAEAQDHDRSIAARHLPTVAAYGDVGPEGSVVTHTVGVSATITIFDGGRIKAQQAEANAAVRQANIEQRELRRQIEMDVRKAVGNLKAAAVQVTEANEEVASAQDQAARVQRRLANGIATASDLSAAQQSVSAAQADEAQAYFSWYQARVDLAAATGSMGTLSLR
jgi:outer membrane protein TolC